MSNVTKPIMLNETGEQIVQKLAEMTESNKSYEMLLNTKADKVDVSAPFNFKGDTTYASLPTSGNKLNDTYYCSDEKCRYTWNGEGWYQSSMNEVDYTDELAKMGEDLEAGMSQLSSEIVYDNELTFDKVENIEYLEGVYRQYYDASKVSDEGFTATGVLEVKSGDIIKVSGTYGNAVAFICAYGEGDVYNQSASVYNPSEKVSVIDYEYVVPNGIYKLTFSSYNDTELIIKNGRNKVVKDKIAEIETVLEEMTEKECIFTESGIDTEQAILSNSKVKNASVVLGSSNSIKKIGRTKENDDFTNCISGATLKFPAGIGGSYAIGFSYDGDSLDLIFAGQGLYRIKYMNGKEWVYLTNREQSYGYNHNKTYTRINVKFASAKVRNIVVEISKAFYGVVVDKTKSLFYLSDKNKPTCVVVGTSITEALTVIGFRHFSWGRYLCDKMGFDFVNCGQGGTGYTADNNGNYYKYGDRIDYDVVGAKPEYCIIEGGRNDSLYANSTTEERNVLLTAVQNCIDTIKNGSPNTKLVLVGRYQEREISGTTEPTSTVWTENTYDSSNELFIANDIIRAGALSRNIPFIDLMRGQVVDGNENILLQTGKMMTGTGTVKNPKYDGNADSYLGTETVEDVTHLNVDGQEYMGNYIYPLYQLALQSI